MVGIKDRVHKALKRVHKFFVPYEKPKWEGYEVDIPVGCGNFQDLVLAHVESVRAEAKYWRDMYHYTKRMGEFWTDILLTTTSILASVVLFTLLMCS